MLNVLLFNSLEKKPVSCRCTPYSVFASRRFEKCEHITLETVSTTETNFVRIRISIHWWSL